MTEAGGINVHISNHRHSTWPYRCFVFALCSDMNRHPCSWCLAIWLHPWQNLRDRSRWAHQIYRCLVSVQQFTHKILNCRSTQLFCGKKFDSGVFWPWTRIAAPSQAQLFLSSPALHPPSLFQTKSVALSLQKEASVRISCFKWLWWWRPWEFEHFGLQLGTLLFPKKPCRSALVKRISCSCYKQACIIKKESKVLAAEMADLHLHLDKHQTDCGQIAIINKPQCSKCFQWAPRIPDNAVQSQWTCRYTQAKAKCFCAHVKFTKSQRKNICWREFGVPTTHSLFIASKKKMKSSEPECFQVLFLRYLLFFFFKTALLWSGYSESGLLINGNCGNTRETIVTRLQYSAGNFSLWMDHFCNKASIALLDSIHCITPRALKCSLGSCTRRLDASHHSSVFQVQTSEGECTAIFCVNLFVFICVEWNVYRVLSVARKLEGLRVRPACPRFTVAAAHAQAWTACDLTEHCACIWKNWLTCMHEKERQNAFRHWWMKFTCSSAQTCTRGEKRPDIEMLFSEKENNSGVPLLLDFRSEREGERAKNLTRPLFKKNVVPPCTRIYPQVSRSKLLDTWREHMSGQTKNKTFQFVGISLSSCTKDEKTQKVHDQIISISEIFELN